MALSPFGEPPPGTDLSADHGTRNNAAVITTFVLAAIAVGLRFYTRFRVQIVQVAADDWMIVAAFVCGRKNCQ
jgi:predicted secreted protein